MKVMYYRFAKSIKHFEILEGRYSQQFTTITLSIYHDIILQQVLSMSGW